MLLLAQTLPREKPAGSVDQQTDIDPLALKVLKAVTDPIRNASAFSFLTRTMRENLGTNGQTITYFTASEVIVVRPDKLKVTFRGRGRDVQLYYDGGKAVLYSPGPNLYATISAPQTLDAVLDRLEERGVYLPVKNLLESDPYQSLASDLKTGYVIGRVEVFGTTPIHQLAFTEDKAEWQLWTTGLPNPRIQRMEVIDKGRTNEPRILIEFSDWDLSPVVQPDAFTFKVPAGAKQIEFSKVPAPGGGD